jgi:hypothetical protein
MFQNYPESLKAYVAAFLLFMFSGWFAWLSQD